MTIASGFPPIEAEVVVDWGSLPMKTPIRPQRVILTPGISAKLEGTSCGNKFGRLANPSHHPLAPAQSPLSGTSLQQLALRLPKPLTRCTSRSKQSRSSWFVTLRCRNAWPGRANPRSCPALWATARRRDNGVADLFRGEAGAGLRSKSTPASAPLMPQERHASSLALEKAAAVPLCTRVRCFMSRVSKRNPRQHFACRHPWVRCGPGVSFPAHQEIAESEISAI